MENDDKTQLPETPEVANTENAAETELTDTNLDEVSGGLRSDRFPTGAPLPPIKIRPENILTPRED